jgi:hypothetical protein
MAETYSHPTAESATADQQWIIDVTRVIKEKLGWSSVDLTVSANSIILSSNTGKGIKVDLANPTYPYFDLLGVIHVDESGGPNRPSFTIYKSNVKQWQFGVDNHIYIDYHLPHDYVPNSNLFIHVHWSTNAVSSAGAPTFEIEATSARGFHAFSNNITVSVSNSYIGPYVHMISETQLSSPNGTGSLLDSNGLSTDGLICIRTRLLTNTMSVNPFVHQVDIHYQSTGIGTKNKSGPNFYT